MNRKKAIRITLITIATLPLLLALAALVIVRTQTFSRFLLAKIV